MSENSSLKVDQAFSAGLILQAQRDTIAAFKNESRRAAIAKHRAHAPSINIEPDLVRLRQSKKNEFEDELGNGRNVGVEWALKTAAYGELRRLSRFATDGEIDARDLLETIEDDGRPSWADANDFVESLFGTPDVTSDSLVGFMLGANEIFEMV